ncbi:amidohydrolase/deacetylase family metallohydrolase [Pleomorphovibrio marinus]|uniref:amidohydrolase/deacetylase family metallohydrolase n=1 Tax=Pleomorphovibrio marinus TaxID=2164132 RepID=UPI000E0B1D1B|nr:amidohydrolase/deacetylase family metallohydrolase [Pleomorphovibrio marinus]
MNIKFNVITVFFLLCLVGFAFAQDYDLVIKNGHVIDPKSGIDASRDVAIKDGKIAKIAASIPGESARQVVNAEGMVVVPGLIDIHGHNFAGTRENSYLSDGLTAVDPDGYTFRVGVTTIVDCGGPGWKNIHVFKNNIIDPSKTRVLAFMNIVGEGMRGGAWEQDTTDMNAEITAQAALKYKEHVVGFKVAHYSRRDWIPIDRAVEAGNIADMPVIIDFGGSMAFAPLRLRELFFERLRPGDIYTHTFAELGGAREPIVDYETREFKPFIREAQERGIIFDVGYGGASFDFRQAIPALEAGFLPNTISTDLHKGSMNAAMKDILNIMSKFLAMGVDLPKVIEMSTWEPAKVIKREMLGHLSEGGIADVAILGIREGNFGFWDRNGYKIDGDRRFECQMTIKDGKIVYDLNGIVDPIVLK